MTGKTETQSKIYSRGEKKCFLVNQQKPIAYDLQPIF